MVNAVFVFVVLFIVLVLMARTDKSLSNHTFSGENCTKDNTFSGENCTLSLMQYGIWLLVTGKNKYYHRKRLGL